MDATPKKRILVIDDDIHILELLKILLEREGYEVLEAQDGEKGISLFRETHVDLIITDIFMDNKDGIETVLELKRESPNVKIIAISGGGYYEPEMYLKIAKEFGAVRAFTKPFYRDDLLTAIREIIE